MLEPLPSFSKHLSSDPVELDLLELFEQSALNIDGLCQLSWIAEGPINPKLVLTVFTARSERSTWTGQSGFVSEPQWQLDLEESNSTRKKIWGDLKTSDLALVASLLPRLNGQDNDIPPEPTSKIGRAFGDQGFDQMSGSLLKRSILAHVASAAENQPEPHLSVLERGMILQGDIKETSIFDILQSIGFCKMSGKLNVSELDRFFEMYFDEGEAVHARSAHATSEAGGQLEGLDALLDLFCWDAGAYNFQPGVITKTRTIKEGLQGVLMEGAMLKDYRSYLKKLNLTRKSVLSVTKENCEISPEQLSKVLNNGIDVNLEIQKTIFQDLKVPKSLDKLIENHKLNRLVWIPIVFNLLNLKLVEIVHAS